MKYKIKDIAQFFGNHLEKAPEGASGFSVDSRSINPQEIYCALPGAKVDGHEFVDEAFKKGASCAIVKEDFKGSSLGPLIYVKDVVKALQDYAKAEFKQKRPKVVIGVTGSLGKTTTKEFISTLLESVYTVFRSPGNSNSQVGLPLALLNHFNGEDVAVLEMGMTHPGNITGLLQIAPPDMTVLTKVALVHAQNYESIEEIAKTKAEIFLHPDTYFGLYAKEIERVADLSSFGSMPKKSFGVEESQADYSLVDHSGWVFKVGKNHIPLGEIPDLGKHNLHNLLAALSVAYELGVDPEKFKSQIQHLKLPERRLQRILKKGILFINDSYNAALDSVKAALHAMPAPQKGGKKIAVLGSMMELGKFSEECHRLVGIEALPIVEHLICYGIECQPMVDIWKKQGRKVDHLPTHGDIIALLHQIVKEGDVVLLKGSRSKMMWKIVEDF